MFEYLSDRLTHVFDRLKGRGVLREQDMHEALREVRRALLEADVSLSVARDFVARVGEKALGQEVLHSVTPGQQVVKIVHDELVALLGEGSGELVLSTQGPAVIVLVGLQGSGKTTTAGKLALRLRKDKGWKVFLASVDVYRPAAREQLDRLAERAEAESLKGMEGESPLGILIRALEWAKTAGADALILDTAGRTHLDEALMCELEGIEKTIGGRHETLLVVDALMGQDAVRLAEGFGGRVDLTGVILTRLDGDGRGGAALSMRAVTGKPICYVGIGEKLEDLDVFRADRVAGRILGMGDVVGLVERVARDMDAEALREAARKVEKGEFSLNDLATHLGQMNRLGGMEAMLDMLPGMKGMKDRLSRQSVDGRLIARQIGMISSMTPEERSDPSLFKASRKRRVAAGAGVKVEDVNRLLKMHGQMADMMKAVGAMKQTGGMGALGSLLGKGGLPGLSSWVGSGFEGRGNKPFLRGPGGKKSRRKGR